MTIKEDVSNSFRWGVRAAIAATLCLTATAAVAQPGAGEGRGGPALSPEKQEAAWTLQAKGVAAELGLDAEATAKVVTAYIASRKSQREAFRGLAGGGGGGGAARFQEMQKISDAERAKLKTELTTALNEEQANKAMATLGAFSRQWDRYTDAISGYGLDAEKQNSALTHIAAYVKETDAARVKAIESGDMQSIRAAMQAAKAKLDTAMAGVLSPEQLTKWKEDTAMRQGGGGGGGLGGGGGQGSAPNQPPAPAPSEAPKINLN